MDELDNIRYVNPEPVYYGPPSKKYKKPYNPRYEHAHEPFEGYPEPYEEEPAYVGPPKKYYDSQIHKKQKYQKPHKGPHRGGYSYGHDEGVEYPPYEDPREYDDYERY